MEYVYVRAGWLNRPEDLKGGRLDHYGKHELVPTNQMDFIDAQAVNGTFELIHYEQLEDYDWKNASGKDKYFWRQTFDFITKSLSVRLEANHVRSDISPDTLTDPTGHAFMVFLECDDGGGRLYEVSRLKSGTAI
jgi:hypothetical protein